MSRNQIHLLALLTTTFAIAPLAAQQAGTPGAAVEMFFKATADSNLKAMGMLFGNTKGPVAVTKPDGWEKKLIIMNAFYSGVKVRTLGESDSKDASRRTVTTELSRGAGYCKVVISVTTMKSAKGWLVYDFDSSEAQGVNRHCEGGLPGNSGD